MLSLLAKLAPKLLPVLGRLGKGRATIAGDVAAVVGVATTVASPHLVTDANIVAVLHEVGLAITALGGLISSFGLGRKAHEAHVDAA